MSIAFRVADWLAFGTLGMFESLLLLSMGDGIIVRAVVILVEKDARLRVWIRRACGHAGPFHNGGFLESRLPGVRADWISFQAYPALQFQL